MIPVNEPVLGQSEIELLNQCITTGWISSEGPFVSEFENGMARYAGRKFGIAVSNGTAALEVAVSSLRLEPGDEVILPTFTIISCASAIVRAGAVPVLVDADPKTWNMSVVHIEKAITSKTKAIMVVHIYGLPVDMGPLLEIAHKYKLMIIEDAAEAIGQACNGKPCGGFGDVSALSFYANKHVTTGEGGMVLTDDPQIAERCRSLRNLCFQPGRRFVHETLGWNYRMTNLQAAVGLAQLEKLDHVVKRKRQMGKRYHGLLKGINGIQLPLDETPYAENVYWIYGIVLNDEIKRSADEVMQALKDKGVGTRSFFWPMHEQPVFKRMGLFTDQSYPVSERLARKGFYLPSGIALTDEQIDASAHALREVLKDAI